MNKSSKIFMFIVIGILLVVFGFTAYSLINSNSQEIETSVFIQHVEDDKTIKKVSVDQYTWYGYENVTDKKATYVTYGYSLYDDAGTDGATSTIAKWRGLGVIVNLENPNSGTVWNYVLLFGGIAIACVVFFIIMRQAQGGGNKAFSFGKTKARVTTNVKVRFSDVAGAEEEKEELKEIIDFLKFPKRFAEIGARVPKGVLLVGAPGTGKTLFAKAVAGEANVPFFSVSGSDFVEMFVGVGASRVRDLFEVAKKNQPCIVFVDEIDAVGRHRGAGLGSGQDEREQTLNQLLVQMDGFEPNEGIIIMAATNRADILDPALLRPGRFDRQIYVHLPDVRGREAILKVHSRNKPLEPTVNFKVLARMTSGFSGADLENLLNEAAILAVRAGKNMIGNAELYEGIDKVIMGPQKKSRLVTESDKRITAYHESGHAILACLCKNSDRVHEVTIIPRGGAAGYTMVRPESDDDHVSRDKLKDGICVTLGGRVAEELVINDICTGASSDLSKVNDTARKMVTEWGMSEKIGLATYGSDNPIFLGRDMGTHNNYSEKVAAIIDEEIQLIIETEHTRARKLLSENMSILENMARLLIERETIYTPEVEMLMKGDDYKTVAKYMDEHDEKKGDHMGE